MTISFIIPVYNGSGFIVRCLDSITNLNLPEKEYEIIVVDDCSTDDTCAVVNDYAVRHPQVKVFCQPENHRQGAARNRGVKECCGEYVTFIDADDIVLHGFIHSFDIIKAEQTDLVYGFMEIEKAGGIITKHQLQIIPAKQMSGTEFAETYAQERVFSFPPSFVYRRQFLLDVNGFFIEDRQHEDRDWLANIIVQANSVFVNPNFTYRYCNNPNSTCKAPKYSTIFDHVASGIRHIDLSKKLSNKTPNMASCLYKLGTDEIYFYLRFRNLTRYPWKENKDFNDEQHLRPLLFDLRRICRENPMPRQINIIACHPDFTRYCLFIMVPVLRVFRNIKHFNAE